MGTMLMGDDRDLIIGELREGVRAIREHLRRQDDVALTRDQQMEINKREAIKAREEKEARDEARFRVLDEKTSLTGGRVQVLEDWKRDDGEPLVKWHREEGSRLGGRVSLLEQINLQEAAEKAQAEKARAGQEGEKRGLIRTWGLMVALLTTIGAVLAWLGAERLGAMLVQMGVKLGG